MDERGDGQPECFLCGYDVQPCDIRQIEGQLIGARIETVGERTWAFVGLRAPDGVRYRVNLGAIWHDLVARLAEFDPAQRPLRLRVLHLCAGIANPPRADQEPFRVLHALASSLVVLEPDLLVNITDLNHGNYCLRQDQLRRIVPSRSSAAGLRGTIIHNIFKELLKGNQQEPERLLDDALRTSVAQLAEVNADEETMRVAIEPHLANLRDWRDQQRADLLAPDHAVSAETFLLAPELGLKGRLDILIRQGERRQVLELKTGTPRGELPKAEHRWQILGYQALLHARFPQTPTTHPQGTLIYSQTPDGSAQTYGIRGKILELQKVAALRNALVLIRLTNTVPEPPGGKRCEKCVQRRECTQISTLLGWTLPPGEPPKRMLKADSTWYRHWFALLQQEARAVDRAATALWNMDRSARVDAGIAIHNLLLAGPPTETEKHEWLYQFECDNTSELREGDEILLSDGDPVRGTVVSGAVVAIGSDKISIWTREYLEQPRLIDRYSTDIVGQRMVSNLYRWLSADDRLRELVSGEARPLFDREPPLPGAEMVDGLNREQMQAVIQALAMKDYLLIQGPPGTGKTKVIAAIAHALAKRGLRVALAAYTNQATDNMLARLADRGVQHMVRLGHEYAIAPELRRFRLLNRVHEEIGATPRAEQVRDWLRMVPIVAATVATWSSEAHEIEETMPQFHVVILDEASQLTVPAAVGALRWATKFILVGDEQQLPPLVQDEAARTGGLGTSLFASLLVRGYRDAVVALETQYRMHAAICAFPSKQFYGDRLRPARTIAGATLPVIPARHAAILDPASPLVWVEVPPLPDRQPKVNDQEATVVAELAAALIASGLDPADLGVIAPFRAQVARIRQLADDLVTRGVTVDTVDRFQGGERGVMILSLTVSRPQTMATALGTFLADPHRLNVALTRARQKLIILGHRAAIADLPLLAALADHCAAQPGGYVHWGKEA